MRVVGRGYVDAVRNLEVTLRSLGGGSKEKMQEDWESIDLKKCLSGFYPGTFWGETSPQEFLASSDFLDNCLY